MITTNAIHALFVHLSDSDRSDWYFVAEHECFLLNACLRLTSRPKTCSGVHSCWRWILDDVADEPRQWDCSPLCASFANIFELATDSWRMSFSQMEGTKKSLFLNIILTGFHSFTFNDFLNILFNRLI